MNLSDAELAEQLSRLRAAKDQLDEARNKLRKEIMPLQDEQDRRARALDQAKRYGKKL